MPQPAAGAGELGVVNRRVSGLRSAADIAGLQHLESELIQLLGGSPPQLFPDVGPVDFKGFNADFQLPGNFVPAFALANQGEHLQLAIRQNIDD